MFEYENRYALGPLGAFESAANSINLMLNHVIGVM